MFTINFSPQRRDDTLELKVNGEVLTINGQDFDFSPLPEGGRLPHDAIKSEWICSDVTKQDGVLHLSVLLPCGPNANEERRFPKPVTVSNGVVTLPGGDEE